MFFIFELILYLNPLESSPSTFTVIPLELISPLKDCLGLVSTFLALALILARRAVTPFIATKIVRCTMMGAMLSIQKNVKAI